MNGLLWPMKNWFPGQFIQADKETKEVRFIFCIDQLLVNQGLFGQSFQVMEKKIKLGLKKVTIFLHV